MGRFRWSIRSLLLAMVLVGFDCAAMIRAVQQGRLAHSVVEYAAGFGAILLVFNVLVGAFAAYFGRIARRPAGQRWVVSPSPTVIAGLYLAMVAAAVLSVLFLSSGLF